MPSLVKQLFSERPTVLSNLPLVHWVAKHGFDDEGVTAKVPELYTKISSNLNVLMTEPAVMDASDRTARAVGINISSLISFTEDSRKQQRWERGANIKIVKENAADAEVEVDLFHLVTRWAYSCSTPAMLGQAFLEQCPDVMDDIFVFDDQFPMLITGLPSFNSKMSRARAALSRALKAIEEWFQAFQAVEDGKVPGSGWGDMNDISELARMQHRTWRSGGKAVEKAAYANLLGLFWGLHTVSAADPIPLVSDQFSALTQYPERQLNSLLDPYPHLRLTLSPHLHPRRSLPLHH